jgi:predicted PurR-regulated permease PerM
MSARAGDIISGNVARTATVIIATVLVGAVVWWLRRILTPFALALFLMVIIDGLARVLEHRIPRFPRKAALPLSMIITLLIFGGVVYVVASNASAFISQLLAYAPKLNGLIVKESEVLGVQPPQTIDDLYNRLNLPHYLSSVANAFKDIVAGGVFVFIYLIFLIVSRSTFEQKAHLLFATDESFEQARRTFVRIRTGVERYVFIQTLTGALLAVASWALMSLVGLSHAMFWAFLVFTCSFVPILGGAVAIFLPPVFAVLQFGDYTKAVILIAGAEAIHFFVGNFVSPRMQGVTLNVDPIVVVLSLAFWGAIWGVPGAFLSTPLTVVAIVILIQFPNTRWIAIMLSRDGDPESYSEGPPDPSRPVPRAASRRSRTKTVAKS